MVVVEVGLNQDQSQKNVIIVTAKARLDLIKVSLLFNKLAINVMVMGRPLVKHVQNVEVMERFKAMKTFQLKFQKVLMMEQE